VDELRTRVGRLSNRATRQVLLDTDKFDGKEWDTWEIAITAKLRVDGKAIGSEEV
jgi:hypothetical protein